MTSALRLDVAHAVLYVHDVADMIEFYTSTLGFEVTDRGPLGGDVIVFLSQSASDHHQVAFITGRAKPDPSYSVRQVAFPAAGTLDELKALRQGLQADDRVTQI